uniref:Uncharacterized protein n=1 Tax=Rhizophora mucronata TaxID=61149 RepID=A0A2P2QMU0_RHIMU
MLGLEIYTRSSWPK